MTIICTFTFVFVCPIEVKTKAASYFLGSGTESDPYRISTKNDLFLLSSLVNDENTVFDYYNKYYIQTKDIDLENENFIPIGTREESGGTGFSGVYDGNYNNIYNLYVERDWHYNGLFGWMYGGALENLTVYGKINCPNSKNCGGIVGDIGSSDAKYIKNCAFVGSVTGMDSVGGIAGASWVSCTIENCYFNGELSSSNVDCRRGGIVGAINNGWNDFGGSSTIKNCYAVSNVKNICNGGIIGEFRKNHNDSVFLIENNYYLETMANTGIIGDYTYGCSALNKKMMKSVDSFLESPFVHNNDELFNDGYPIFEWQLDDIEKSKPINIPFVGGGTKEEPYQIANIENLISLSEVTNDKSTMDYFSKCHYIQTTDIDLNNKLFTPIAINCDFEGTYNGKYHKITNLKISTSKNYTGLFSKVTDGGCISKLSVEGKVNSSGDNVGGIAGSLTDSASIDNCDYHGTVTGLGNV